MPKIFKRVKAISIHPPRAGRDHVKFSPPHFSCNFNPPAPCGAGPGRRASRRSPTYFNPPAPCGAGLAKDAGYSGSGDFNPPAPCGAGPLCRTPRFSQRNISIHPPHAGRDDFLLGHHIPCLDFNPPAPCGAGPACVRQIAAEYPFQSTRPMRGGTSLAGAALFAGSNFNPPAPCGAGPGLRPSLHKPTRFQSTRLMRGGTAIMHKIYPMHSCTIHNTACSQTTICIPTSVFLLTIRSPSACSPVFRCEPMGSLLRASTSHGQIIRTSSGL